MRRSCTRCTAAAREFLHAANAKHVTAPPIAAEQRRWPHVEFDSSGDDQPEFLLVIGAPEGIQRARRLRRSTDLKRMLEGLQHLAELDIFRRRPTTLRVMQ